jgi:hypothetical protein
MREYSSGEVTPHEAVLGLMAQGRASVLGLRGRLEREFPHANYPPNLAGSAKHAQQLAQDPPGTIPQAGGVDEYGFSATGGIAPCGAMEAYATSNAANASTTCSLESTFGEPYPGEVWLAAKLSCTGRVEKAELVADILVRQSDGTYKLVKWAGSEKKGIIGEDVSEGHALISNICYQGGTYKAWVWGWAGSSGLTWKFAGQASEPWKCEGSFSETIVEGVESLL